MILTISPNNAVDRIIFIDGLTPATTMRAGKMIDHVGGKGLDTSIALTCLGAPTLGLGFAGGYTGRIMADALDRLGVPCELIWLEGETRIAHVIVETQHHRHSHIIAGSLPATAADGAALLERMRAHLPRAQWVVGGGSLPPGLNADFTAQVRALAQAAGLPTLFDMTGAPVHALLAGPGGPPTILKMNEHEFADTFGVADPLDSVEALAAAMAQVRSRHSLPALVLTLGPRGLLAVTGAGSWHAAAPEQQVLNAAGAGDSASAALLWRLSRGENWPQALTWAAAVSAASVLTELTAVMRMVDVERLLPQVALQALAPTATQSSGRRPAEKRATP